MADYATGKIYQVVSGLPPAQATLISPSGAITNTQPTFSWNEVTGNSQGDAATWYYIYIQGPSGLVHADWYRASVICNSGTCSVTPNLTLGGGTHTWWVQTWNPGGYGPWSTGMTFSTPLSYASRCSDPGLAERKYHNQQSHLHLEQGLGCHLVLPVCQRTVRLCVYPVVSQRCRLRCQHLFDCQCHTDPGCWRAPLVDPDLE